MERATTPPRIVERDGTVHVGWFDRPFADANLADAPCAHLLAGLRDTPLSLLERSFRRMRLKQWHYTSIVTDRLMFACAVVDAGYVGNAFAYVVDRETGAKHEYNTLAPLGRHVVIAPNSIDGQTRISQPGWGSIRLDNDSQAGLRKVDVRLEGQLGPRPKPPLVARFEIRDQGHDPDPVVVVEETEPRRWLYTHKCYGLQAGGAVRAGELEDEVPLGAAHAGLDWNRGYRPRVTWWNWAAAGGTSTDGVRVGFNLTAHRPWQGSGFEGGGRDEDAADCALWLGGRCVKVPRIEFDYNPADLMAPWRLRDDAGLVDLRFEPLGKRTDDVDFKVVVSRFHQPYGNFSGVLRSPDGDVHQVARLFGVTEQHFARW